MLKSTARPRIHIDFDCVSCRTALNLQFNNVFQRKEKYFFPRPPKAHEIRRILFFSLFFRFYFFFGSSSFAGIVLPGLCFSLSLFDVGARNQRATQSQRDDATTVGAQHAKT